MKLQDRCKNCVMDISAKEIVFDKNGVCNFCNQAQKALEDIHYRWEDKARKGPISSLPAMPVISKGNKYDVLIGLSGGVDSSYLLHKAVELGYKPLCFSIDNHWNDPKADENIMRLVEGLKVPFFRYTIDKKRFLDLQGAFLQAGVKNIEIPTDHILMASTYEMADKYGIKTIFSGGNVATESIMPASWGYNARDLVHIKAIYKKFKGKKLEGLPMCSIWKWNWYRWFKGIKIVYLLDYLDYNREEAIRILAGKYGYKPYGDKHCESTWTTWFQNFYLFEKFGIDKRKAHYSSLINSGQMTRTEAITELEKAPVYPKLGIENRVMRYKRHEHDEYPMDKWYDRIAKIVKLCKF